MKNDVLKKLKWKDIKIFNFISDLQKRLERVLTLKEKEQIDF